MSRALRIVSIVVVVLAPKALLACVCPDAGSVGDELKSSAAVFLGRIVTLAIERVSLENTTAERMVRDTRGRATLEGTEPLEAQRVDLR